MNGTTLLYIVAGLVGCLGFCAWKSPSYKRKIGFMLQASADADEQRKATYARRLEELCGQESRSKDTQSTGLHAVA
jgi:hypothetical protein